MDTLGQSIQDDAFVIPCTAESLVRRRTRLSRLLSAFQRFMWKAQKGSLHQGQSRLVVLPNVSVIRCRTLPCRETTRKYNACPEESAWDIVDRTSRNGTKVDDEWLQAGTTSASKMAWSWAWDA